MSIFAYDLCFMIYIYQ